MATSIQNFREFERDASDDEVWNRLGRELPAWAHSGVVPPGTTDQGLYRCRTVLDPVNPVDDPSRTAARTAIRLILDDLYQVLICSEWFRRWFVLEVRHARHVRRILRELGLTRDSVRFQAELERVAGARASGQQPPEAA